MRSESRFDRLAGPRMTVEEFMDPSAPGVYDKLREFSALLRRSESLETVRKEFNRLFMEGKR